MTTSRKLVFLTHINILDPNELDPVRNFVQIKKKPKSLEPKAQIPHGEEGYSQEVLAVPLERQTIIKKFNCDEIIMYLSYLTIKQTSVFFYK